MATLKQMLCFAILMENQSGILGKSPDYIREKFMACMDEADWCDGLLDSSNQAKLGKYYVKWHVEHVEVDEPAKEGSDGGG